MLWESKLTCTRLDNCGRQIIKTLERQGIAGQAEEAWCRAVRLYGSTENNTERLLPWSSAPLLHGFFSWDTTHTTVTRQSQTHSEWRCEPHSGQTNKEKWKPPKTSDMIAQSRGIVKTILLSLLQTYVVKSLELLHKGKRSWDKCNAILFLDVHYWLATPQSSS